MLDQYGGYSQMNSHGGYAYEEHEEHEEHEEYRVAAHHESHGGYGHQLGLSGNHHHHHRPGHQAHHGSHGAYFNGHQGMLGSHHRPAHLAHSHKYESSDEEEEEEIVESHQHHMMKQRFGHAPPPLHFMPPPPVAPLRNHRLNDGRSVRREESHQEVMMYHNMNVAPHQIPARHGCANPFESGHPVKPMAAAGGGHWRVGGHGGGYMKAGWMSKALD